jgi:hypothetical protein
MREVLNRLAVGQKPFNHRGKPGGGKSVMANSFGGVKNYE